jgi:hypothetical protein
LGERGDGGDGEGVGGRGGDASGEESEGFEHGRRADSRLHRAGSKLGLIGFFRVKK